MAFCKHYISFVLVQDGNTTGDINTHKHLHL